VKFGDGILAAVSVDESDIFATEQMKFDLVFGKASLEDEA